MAGKIRTSDIEEVKSRVNIADVIGEYVSLKNASMGSLKGLCPFHDEKSASFNVRPAQGFYHCFGCGEGGDVYKFVQRIESLGFYEAVEKVAARISFQLTYEDGNAPQEQGSRARVLEANTAASTYYQSQLMTDAAIPGREFLKGRGFDKAAAELFGVGFAPKGWNNLFDHLSALGFTVDELVAAGLVTKSERGAYDKFRGRLIWPIRDTTSQVIGFGARKLFDDDQGPKYLNTSDTLVYHKSQVLYGLDLAKKDITKRRQVVVVEGYTDVMACYLAGVTTAVATCGTAFGDEHIRILNRMLTTQDGAPAEVIFTFDPDVAGQKAAMRAFADSTKFKADTFVAVGPEGLDPCDLRTSHGDEAVQRMIANRRPLFEFAIRQKLAMFNLESIEGQVGAIRAAAPIVAAISEPALRSAYTRKLIEWVPFDENQVQAMVIEAAKSNRSAAVSNLRLDVSNSQQTSEASVPNEASSISSVVDLTDPINRNERAILEVLLQLADRCSPAELVDIAEHAFSAPAHAAIARSIVESVPLGLAGFVSNVSQRVPQELQGLVRQIAATSLQVEATDEVKLERYIRGVLNSARQLIAVKNKAKAMSKLRMFDREADPAGFNEIRLELAALDSEIQRLKQA